MSGILIVEDNADLRMLYRLAMKNEGYETNVAPNGKAGLELLRQAPQPPCMILLDLMMPVMNGWELLQEIAQDSSLAQIPVVVCSAARDNLPSHVRFLKKPVDLDELIKVAGEYCGCEGKVS